MDKMKKIAFLAAFAALSVVPAVAQGMMKKDKPMMGRAQGKMDPTMGLSPAEKKAVMAHMKKMTPAETAVMKKAYTMRSMGKSEKQAMMGMSKSEKATMMAMMKKMTPMEKKAGMKMMDMAQNRSMKKMTKPSAASN